MRPTVEDLQAIWRFTYSRSSLLDAKNFIGQLSEVPPAFGEVTPESLRYRALVEAAVVSYGRPFTTCYLPPKRQQVVPLQGVSPPEHLAEFHENALIMRDTMIGHKDATPARGYKASPNIVFVRIFPDTYSLNGVMLGEMLPPLKKAFPQLCDHFVRHCESNLSQLTQPYRSEFMQNAPGEYELMIIEPPAAWLVPFKPKHGDDFRAPLP
jgi:hypothetical protein